jgi:hypothetical protein
VSECVRAYGGGKLITPNNNPHIFRMSAMVMVSLPDKHPHMCCMGLSVGCWPSERCQFDTEKCEFDTHRKKSSSKDKVATPQSTQKVSPRQSTAAV